jgi:hypothetical protein
MGVAGRPETARQRSRWAASRRIRVLLTLLGAAGLVTAAFVSWIRSIDDRGVSLHVRMLWNPNGPTAITGGGITSIGFVALLLGAIALIGILPRVGWLTLWRECSRWPRQRSSS